MRELVLILSALAGAASAKDHHQDSDDGHRKKQHPDQHHHDGSGKHDGKNKKEEQGNHGSDRNHGTSVQHHGHAKQHDDGKNRQKEADPSTAKEQESDIEMELRIFQMKFVDEGSHGHHSPTGGHPKNNPAVGEIESDLVDQTHPLLSASQPRLTGVSAINSNRGEVVDFPSLGGQGGKNAAALIDDGTIGTISEGAIARMSALCSIVYMVMDISTL